MTNARNYLFTRLHCAAAMALVFVLLLIALPNARAQSTNQDLTAAIFTNSARVATGSAITSANQTNTDKRGVICTWATTASSGSTDSTFSIQGYDTATNVWYTIKTSAAIKGGSTYATDAPNTPYTLAVYPGVAVSSLATGNEAQSAVLPRTWRISQTNTAKAGVSSPTVTSKVGCNYIK